MAYWIITNNFFRTIRPFTSVRLVYCVVDEINVFTVTDTVAAAVTTDRHISRAVRTCDSRINYYTTMPTFFFFFLSPFCRHDTAARGTPTTVEWLLANHEINKIMRTETICVIICVHTKKIPARSYFFNGIVICFVFDFSGYLSTCFKKTFCRYHSSSVCVSRRKVFQARCRFFFLAGGGRDQTI